ncbi:DNA recombination protein RmuC [Solimonas terrae]|uniref:DNA recombination protein RmuC n=1 Tax=Solimonas terrae TaxID=1396819 RepID=A0A6M2BUF4_9GAMM|nr:DNA recombination protein RmuC [Solimonas terrae]NGY05557.1 DNA recombination protein RmuC [Solimonas terrae]
MNLIMVLLVAVVGAFVGGALATLLRRPADAGKAFKAEAERLERALRDEAAQTRRDAAELTRGQRAELTATLTQFGQQLQQQQESLRATLADTQRQLAEDAQKARGEQAQTLARFGEQQSIALKTLVDAQMQAAEKLRASVDDNLKTLRGENAEKLEQMRRTVDEKLHETLEKRLGESFKLVSDRLEQVHKGLGEMQTLANGVGDLKRVLSNVKTRGGWGEVQLESILEQIFTAEQFARQVATKPGSREVVDCAIRLPGRGEHDSTVWLPIDAKFPSEDYERLVDAVERADLEAIKISGAQLQRTVEIQAKSIGDKYIAPPDTTDFAVMFLPTEGLYAEVIRRPGIVEKLQREHRVVLAGPTTLTALLNSLQMGFRTLAIEKRTSEVWRVLGAVKTEFGKFGEVLDKVSEKLDQAQKQITQTGVRSRAITRQLREVEALPASDTDKLLGSVGDDEAAD